MYLAITAFLLAALTGCARPGEDRAGSSPAGGAPASASTSGAAQALGPSTPTRLRIPEIGVDTKLVALDLRADRTMEVPRDFALAGWYRRAPTPGERGPAVIAGHFDSRRGPAVFYRLRELRPGDPVTVHRADGTTVDFRVEQVGRYPKDAFPTARVYGNLDHAGLRLITCGGTFDRSSGHYRDNVVVYARLSGSSSGTR
jgi:sortase (surface protein transpeptidase)